MKKSLLLTGLVFFFSILFFLNSAIAQQNAPVKAAVLFFMPTGNAYENPFTINAEKGIATAAKAFPNILSARIYPYSTTGIHEYVKFSAERGHKIMVGIGSYYAEAFEKIAHLFPDKHFIVIEGKSDLKNIKSILYDNYEAGYLAGAAAAVCTKTDKVAFIGAMPGALIDDYKKGFTDAVKKYNPKAIVSIKYISLKIDGFSNKEKAYEISSGLYRRNYDIIFGAAGESGLGIIDAARTNKKYAIGVDANQDGISKGYVLTSVVKNLDTAIVNLVQSISENKYTSRTQLYNVGNVGISLTDFEYTKDKISKQKMDKIKDIIFNIKKGHTNSLTSEIHGKR
jgi:basic membrane protein A